MSEMSDTIDKGKNKELYHLEKRKTYWEGKNQQQLLAVLAERPEE